MKMQTMQLAFSYLAARANRLGRVVFRSDAGALTLEWLVIAAALFIAAGAAVAIFATSVDTYQNKLK
jgi:hypothetical protein